MSAVRQVQVDDAGITVRASFEKVVFPISGKSVPMLKLSVPLVFGCKATDISELSGSSPQLVYVFKRLDLSEYEFDYFSRNLLRKSSFLTGFGCSVPVAGARACVMIVCAGRPVLFVDSQGADYARYVARFG